MQTDAPPLLCSIAGRGTSARMSVPRIFDEHRRSLRRDRAFPRLAEHGFLLDAMAEEMIERLRDVSRSFGNANVSLGYYGADGNGRDNFGKLADNRVVLAVKVGR